jgi:hypothetical protein
MQPEDQAQIDFENEGGETYICGNPPYKGRNKKGSSEKDDTRQVFDRYGSSFASLDYVANWLLKAAEYSLYSPTKIGLVATNSICQGEQVALLWPVLFKLGLRISFAHTSFKWSNLASDQAGVTVVVVGLDRLSGPAMLMTDDQIRTVESIGPYLVPNSSVVVAKAERPISKIGTMHLGNMPKDGGNLVFDKQRGDLLIEQHGVPEKFVRPFYGAEELINARPRACVWVSNEGYSTAKKNAALVDVFTKVADFRGASSAASTRAMAAKPFRFVQLSAGSGTIAIIVPRVSSENRQYLPVDYFNTAPVIGDKCFALYDEPIWNFSLIASRLHIIWIGVVCSRLEMRYSYGNKLGWNTFPVPKLTDKNRADLTAATEGILLAREAHFPATIAELYDPEKMPENLHAAHDHNDEVLERIYIGRRFRNDTERLEKLFEMYTRMTTKVSA